MSSSISYDELSTSYFPLRRGEEYEEFQGIWGLKSEESVGAKIWNLKDNPTDKGGEIPELMALIRHSTYDITSNQAYYLDVMCAEVTDCFVTDDNNKADWYVIHSLVKVNGSLELEAYDGMLAPSHERPTKIPQAGGSFPVEMAFHRQEVQPRRFQGYMSLPCEKDLVGKSNSQSAPPAMEMFAHLLNENKAEFPSGQGSAKEAPSTYGWFIDWIASETTYPGGIVVTNGACKYIAENYPKGIEFVHYCKGLDWSIRDVIGDTPATWGSDPTVITTRETSRRYVKLKFKIKAHPVPES